MTGRGYEGAGPSSASGPSKASVPRSANNLDALRLLGAMLVLVGHTAWVRGRDSGAILDVPIHTFGLLIFFSISGYLISKSWKSDPNLLRYLTRRSLRIFPGLAAVVILTTLVLGPVFSTNSTADYFSSAETWTYLRNVLLWPVYTLPGVFESNPVPSLVNASLWSLPAEFACYLIVPAVGAVPARYRSLTYLVLGVAAGTASALMFANQINVEVLNSPVSSVLEVWPFFMIGAALGCAPRWLTFDWRVAVALTGVAMFGAVVDSPLLPFALWFVVPYVSLTIGLASTPVVRRSARFGDLSYGIYLYSFPVTQVLALIAPVGGYLVSIVAGTVISAGLAFASWHLVEKRALMLKPSRRKAVVSAA